MSASFASRDEAVRAALDEKAMDVLGTIRKLESAIKANDSQGDPDYKTELKYYTAHYNAYNKALFYWDKVLRPTQASNGDWLIPSGSEGGLVHRETRDGMVWTCGPSCKATAFHWHGAIIEGMERAAELLDMHDDLAAFEAAAELDDDPWLPRVGDDDLAGRVRAARLAAAKAAADAMNDLYA